MTPYELERKLEEVLGETQEENGYDYYEEYTGLNVFYHTLAGTGSYTMESSKYPNTLTFSGDVNNDNRKVSVEGVGEFKLVEKTEENFDTYEKSWDNFVVFEFDGKTYRKEGNLDSYDGGIWDGRLHEVRGVEKVITVWETV